MPRTRCAFCTPEGHHTPSGFAWFHQDSCPRFARQRVSQAMAMAMAETVGHPAGSNLTVRTADTQLKTWFKHTPGHDCEACRYIEAHLDDEL